MNEIVQHSFDNMMEGDAGQCSPDASLLNVGESFQKSPHLIRKVKV
jgi:hypothetical protein